MFWLVAIADVLVVYGLFGCCALLLCLCLVIADCGDFVVAARYLVCVC